MKNKKILLSGLIILLVVVVGITYYVFNREDKDTTLNLLERQWIENNKNRVIDISIINNVPIFSYGGQGLIFDLINSVEEVTGLDFNRIPYQRNNELSSEYTVKVKDTVEENDILIHEDNYIILTKYKTIYRDVSDIVNLQIGVLSGNLDEVNRYLSGSNNVSYKSYDSVADLINEVKSDEVDAIVLPRINSLEEIIKDDSLNIAYHINEMKQYYVLTLNGEDRLNNIIKKYYNKWSNENFNDTFSKHLTQNYFDFKEIDEHDIVKFRSKSYLYGFVENSPYDFIKSNRLEGINSSILKSLSNLSNIEILFEKFSNYEELVKSFNENKIDFYFNINGDQVYSLDVVEMDYAYNDRQYVLSNSDRNIIVNSLNSLLNEEVAVLKNSITSKYLIQNNIKVNEFDNIDKLLKNTQNNTIFILDEAMYRYHQHALTDKKLDYAFRLNDNYNFISRDISDNSIFNEYLSFYLTFIPTKEIINETLPRLSADNEKGSFSLILIVYGAAVVGVYYIVSLLITFIKKLRIKKEPLTKTDKFKYIDMLTSLKNRNFFNDNVKVWDESEVYPQTIVIVDLNNIAYINDNYGHEEGDNVIKEAANILINNQMDNSEIIRTDGNEFLIYMVGYEEKDVVSYTKRLSKELSELAHNFGAAIGYSIIQDAIKTIDDAVNEATLAMREDKEEII